ncbi:MAG: [protein-PII] uridylyltransferase [Actinomycetia bacterium]|nr:[protein-PII] uridylyltransferase [Actinomycetes bacterium]
MAKSAGPLLVAPELKGRAYAEAHTDATDQWFQQIYHQALGGTDGLALVAVGGYGRRVLCPFSDIDVILVHDDLDNYADAAEALWYPVWDRGIKMGYAVVNLVQAAALVREELHWATALLSTRLVAGDPDLLSRLDEVTTKAWADNTADLMGRLAESVHARHGEHGDVAFQIEPHLKEGRGGLRDLHALGWAARAVPDFDEGRRDQLQADADTLIEARVELHRLAGRAGDVLNLEAQDDVAAALDDTSHDLMVRLALAARRIAWHSDEAWSHWERRTGRATPIGVLAQPMSTDFGLVDGYIEVTDKVDVVNDPLVILRLAATAANTNRTIGRASLELVRDKGASMPEPWPAEARRLFAEIFLAGRPAITVVEDLDQFDLMTRLIPEWEAVRCHPQRNVMHTYTVDRHLCEAAANASQLVDRVSQPDLLVIGALFHDIGKGYPGRDHTEVGMRLIATMAARLGYPDDEVAVLVDLCRHHLLLPDVATRRDLADPGTMSAVAAAVDSVDFLDMLAALTEADSIATGPAAWGSWKAGLLEGLVSRTTFVLEGGAPAEVAVSDWPSPDIVELMSQRHRILTGEGSTFTVVAPDRPALFSQLAGVLAVNGLDVLNAMAVAGGDSMVACQFTLQPPSTGHVDWDKVSDMAARALEGRVALTARVRQRAQAYARYQRRLSAAPPRLDVVVDNEISDVATVVEVHAADTVGLLFWITQALAELRLDIRSAKVQTFGPQAVDSFYVCNGAGEKLSDPELLQELDLAIRHAVGQEMP